MQRQKGLHWPPPNRRYGTIASRVAAGLGSEALGRDGPEVPAAAGPRLLTKGLPVGASPLFGWGRVPHRQSRRGQRSPVPTGGGTRPVQVAWGRGSGTQSTKGHSHVWAKGSASEGQPRLQRSAFGGSDAQAHTILLRPRAHTGLPVLDRNHPTNAENRAGMGDRTRAAIRLRDRHVCQSRRGQARAPHSVPATGGPRCWRPEPLLQTSPVPAPPLPPHAPPVGQRRRPPGAPLLRTELGAAPQQGGAVAWLGRGRKASGAVGTGQLPRAQQEEGQTQCTASPSPRSSRCCQDPDWPDHAGDPRPRPDLQGGERPAQQSGCCVPTTLRGSQRTRTSHLGGTAAGGGHMEYTELH